MYSDLRKRYRIMSIVVLIFLILLSPGGAFYASTIDRISSLIANDNTMTLENEESSLASDSDLMELNDDSHLTIEEMDLNDVDYELAPLEPEKEVKAEPLEEEQEAIFLEEVFESSVAVVDTFDKLRLAVANPMVSRVEVMDDLIRESGGAPIGTLNRDLVINGNGHEIHFGSDNGSLILGDIVEGETATLRVEDAVIGKSGSVAIFMGIIIETRSTSNLERIEGANWTIEFEDITELATNEASLVMLPRGKVAFTSGTNTFNRSDLGNIFIQAKDIEVTGEAHLTINRENANASIFYSGSLINAPTITITEGANVFITTGNGIENVIDLRGPSSTIAVTDTATLSVTTSGQSTVASNTANNAILLSGENSTLTITEKSQVDVQTSGTKRGIALVGADSNFIVTDANLEVATELDFGVYTSGVGANVNFKHAQGHIKTTSGRGFNFIGEEASIVFENSVFGLEGQSASRIHLEGNEGKLHLINSEFNLNSTTGYGIYLLGDDSEVILNQTNLTIAMDNASSTIYMEGVQNRFIIEKKSQVDLDSIHGSNIWLIGDHNTFAVSSGAKVTASSVNAGSIFIHGSQPAFKVSGEETELNVTSTVSEGDYNAAVFLGTPDGAESPGATIEIFDHANVKINSDLATAFGISSKGGNFYLSNKGSLFISSGDSMSSVSGAHAPLRFLGHGEYDFVIDQARMEIRKTGGNAPGIRMFGGNNNILVKNEGNFIINNPGIAHGTDGGVSGGSQGVHYPANREQEGLNSFTVDGEGSVVQIIAASGAAIDMISASGNRASGTVSVTNGGYFQAVGQTSSASGGIFNAQVLEVNFENPLFMDLRNNRPGGGNIFNVQEGSILRATNSDLALWQNGTELDGDPQRNWTNIDYTLSGSDFNHLEWTNVPVEFNMNPDSFGSDGLAAYSRLSSNNSRAIVDELRVPTNADKLIFGHASIPIGLGNVRPAWSDEVTVTVEVERVNGSTEVYTAKTVGSDDENEGISIYGEAPRPGLFQIELKEFLQEGDRVRVLKASRGQEERPRPSLETEIQVEEVVTFPIIPPAPAKINTSYIYEHTTAIRGQITDLTAKLSATYNGEKIDLSEVEIGLDGSFEIPLTTFDLKVGDEFQIFLQDQAGSAAAAGVVNPPHTNNEHGNINPITPLDFHDTTFAAAPLVKVLEMLPIPPLDPLNPEIEVIPENKPQLPANQGDFSIDFVSRLDFGKQIISTKTQKYYAKPQQLLEVIEEDSQRPNYIQISDRREESLGWELSVRQEGHFTDDQGQKLPGAELRFQNGQIATASTSPEPSQIFETTKLLPNTREILMTAKQGEGQGTWIYRFGDESNFEQSVYLEVPGSSLKIETSYKTVLNWQLSSTPGNHDQ